MKGVILAGGTGSRLFPLTKTANKHLLPVYDKPMICYPLETLKKSGIEDVLIISSSRHAGEFLEFLGSGYDIGLDLKYTIQDKPLGIAHAIWIARNFAGEEDVAVMLGDNLIGDDLRSDVESFDGGAKVFLKEVQNPEQFGIAAVQNGRITDIVEKPENPPSSLAVTGVYLYENSVFEYTERLELSDRGELEVTDLNRLYLEENRLDYRTLDSYWFDTGTFEGLYKATDHMRDLAKRGKSPGIKIEENES